MRQANISFYAKAVYVIDLMESMLFYRRLGYKVIKEDKTQEFDYAVMKLPGSSGERIELREPFNGEGVGRTVSVFTLNSNSELKEERRTMSKHDVVEDLMFRGFTFANMTPKEFYTSEYMEHESISMVDPQGAWIEFLYRL